MLEGRVKMSGKTDDFIYEWPLGWQTTGGGNKVENNSWHAKKQNKKGVFNHVDWIYHPINITC